MRPMAAGATALLDALAAAERGGLRVAGEALVPWKAIHQRAMSVAGAAAPHARVGVCIPSGPDLLAGLFGVMAAGGLVVPISPQWPGPARERLVQRLRLDALWTALPAAGDVLDAARPDGELALLTSGSTGEPAAAVLGQDALVANARGIIASLGITESERTLCIPPFHGAYGFSVVTSHILSGAEVVLEPRSAFPATVLQTLAAQQCTAVSAVPTTWRILMRQDGLVPGAFPSLRMATIAGGALSVDQQVVLRERLGAAGLFVMFGQTEACARLTCLPPEGFARAPASVGRPLPGVELRIADDGEVLARGPNLMRGYLDDPERTAAVLRDGCLHTGDLGTLDDDGNLTLLGRKKHVLKVGEMRVAPLAVEAALCGLTGVSEAAVVGTPDALLGEVPIAFVVSNRDVREILDEISPLLAPWERPRRIERLDRLPTLPSGKIDLTALRSRAAGN